MKHVVIFFLFDAFRVRVGAHSFFSLFFFCFPSILPNPRRLLLLPLPPPPPPPPPSDGVFLLLLFFCFFLRVEGEHRRLIASHQQEGRHVGRQRLQPGHVQRRADRPLARHRQRPIG